jgi:hypothetical protein
MADNRRDFLKKALITSAGISLGSGLTMPSMAQKSNFKTPSGKMIGIQMGPHSFYDEGMENVLDFLSKEANINTLMFYTHTYYGVGSRPKQVLAHDHGVKPRDFSKSKLPKVWVKHHEEFFKNTILRHHKTDSSYEYSDRDIFNEIQNPARDRGMRIYVRLLEPWADEGVKYIKNFDEVVTENVYGEPGYAACWNNPDYRNWLYATAEDIFTHYNLDGMQYGAERVGPISQVLVRGRDEIPTCFCEHCRERNKKNGIDPERAREGYKKLYEYMHKVSSGKDDSHNTVMVNILRYLQLYPEILGWNYQWFRADEEIQEEMYRRIKKIKPEAQVGRHIDHQRSSWDIFYRSAVTYREMAEFSDFIKPILYQDIYGPRMKDWVVDPLQKTSLNDLTKKQVLNLFYSWMGYSKQAQIAYDDLERKGMNEYYVYDETKRCVQGVDGNADVVSGIGIDVPWYVPGGMIPYPSDPIKLRRSVYKAIQAGATGLLASRDYDEMRHSSLKVFGDAVKRIL